MTEALWKAGIVPRYSANITGHGWRKLLRHPKALTYRIPPVPPKTAVLDFIQRQAGQDDREAYSTLNMGAGFALFVKAEDAERTRRSRATAASMPGWRGVEAGEKQRVH